MFAIQMICSKSILQQATRIRKVSTLCQGCYKVVVKPQEFATSLSSYRGYSILVKMTSENKTGKTEDKGKTMPKALLNDIEEKATRVTRHYAKEAEKNWKEHYLNLPEKEKRKLYQCGKNYVTIDSIEDWPSYAAKVRKKNAKSLRMVKRLFEVDEELNTKVVLWRGDITTLEIDVICNAANNSLLGGGGVDGSIHRAAGKKLLEECSRIGGCKTGDAKLTGGYLLPARYILHTVGPIGEQPKALESCYRTCLNLAKEHELRTVAFPCISTGIYGYDVEKATPVVMQTVRDWLLKEENSKCIDKIIFCVFLSKDVEVYEMNLLNYFPVGTPVAEIPDKKKPKTEDETKNKKGKEKKDKEQKIDSKEPKAEKEHKEESVKKENELELPEKKKPKTVEETKDKVRKDKELKENKSENTTEAESETKKEESERNEVKVSSL